MKFNNIQFDDNARVDNLTLAHGTSYPPNANEGELFFNSSDNLPKVYNGSAWANVPLGQNPNFKNAFVNPQFGEWQRGTTRSSEGSSGAIRAADQWFMFYQNYTASASRKVVTTDEIDVLPESVFTYCNVVSTLQSSLSNSYITLDQGIEGVRTHQGKTVTISFWARSNNGNKNLSIEMLQNFGTGGSPSATVQGLGVKKFSIGTSWKKYFHTFALPSTVGKSIGTNNNDTLRLKFWFAAGSSFNSRTDSVGEQNNIDIDITAVQIEDNAEPSGFEARIGLIERLICRRYLYVPQGALTLCGFATHRTSTTYRGFLYLPVEMRSIPTVSLSSTDSTNTFFTITQGGTIFSVNGTVTFDPGRNGVSVVFNVTSGQSASGYHGPMWINGLNSGYTTVIVDAGLV